MDQRVVDRLAASYEAEIGGLKRELKAVRHVCGYVWELCNLVINSQKFAGDETMLRRLEFVRDEAKVEMEKRNE